MAKIRFETETRRPSVPFQLVRYFEEELQRCGIPIRFEATIDRECGYAKRLLRLCKGRKGEAEALIREFAKDKWEREHNRSLSRVGNMADELRARIIQGQQRAARHSDEILVL